MTNGTGAASAAPDLAPATPDEALALISQATTVEQLEFLLAYCEEQESDWRRAKLEAERRLGILLGQAQHGGDRRSNQVSSGHLTNAQKQRRKKARKVAAVPDDVFNEYVANADEPTREGLLRAAGLYAVPDPPRQEPRASEAPTVHDTQYAQARDREIIEWVRARARAGWDREQTVAASKAGTDGWPRPGKELSNGSYGEVMAAIWGAEMLHLPPSSAERWHSVREAKRRGKNRSLYDVRNMLMEAIAALEMVEAHAFDVAPNEKWMLVDVVWDLNACARWLDRVVPQVGAHMEVAQKMETIAKLRARTVANGATAPEEATARAMADKLEAKLRGLN